MNRIDVLEQAIKFLRDKEMIDREYMEPDDLCKLQETIKSLVVMKIRESAFEYKNHVQRFLKYLETCGQSEKPDMLLEDFASIDYTLTHGDQQVILGNDAELYEGLCGMLKNYIDNLLCDE